MRFILAAGFLALLATCATASAQGERAPYQALSAIAMPDGRWDLLSVDSAHHRALIARGDSVTIVDLTTGSAKSIGTIARGHAAAAIDGTDLIAVTSGGDNTVRLIDANTGSQTASIPVGDNPDAAFYDAGTRRLVVMNAKGGTVSIVDPRSTRVVSTIKVKPALELGVLVGRGLLAINDEDAGEIELVDLRRGSALKPVALTGCEGPTGIAYDPADGLLLSACANGKAALVDARSRRVLRLLPIGSGPDGALFDPRHRRFLVPCGRSGTLSVFAVARDRTVTALATVPTEAGARTAALDPTDGRVYLPTTRFAPASGGGRPTLLPGTVHLIVLQPVS